MVLRTYAILVFLALGFACSASYEFRTTESAISTDPITLSADEVILRPEVPITRTLLNSALCLELDGMWEIASGNTIQFNEERTVTIDVACVTGDQQRHEALYFYKSLVGERREFCAQFNDIPRTRQVIQFGLRADDMIAIRRATWREKSPK